MYVTPFELNVVDPLMSTSYVHGQQAQSVSNVKFDGQNMRHNRIMAMSGAQFFVDSKSWSRKETQVRIRFLILFQPPRRCGPPSVTSSRRIHVWLYSLVPFTLCTVWFHVVVQMR